MKQQDALRQAMQQNNQTRAALAAGMGISRRTLDKWLLPETSNDFRHMPETAWRLLASQYGLRKSSNLAMPYDWSNPAMADEALILATLRWANFKDLVRICIDFGLDPVRSRLETALSLVPETERDILRRILSRMLRSIKLAFAEREAA